MLRLLFALAAFGLLAGCHRDPAGTTNGFMQIRGMENAPVMTVSDDGYRQVYFRYSNDGPFLLQGTKLLGPVQIRNAVSMSVEQKTIMGVACLSIRAAAAQEGQSLAFDWRKENDRDKPYVTNLSLSPFEAYLCERALPMEK